MAKLVYKPLGLFFSVLGGILAGALFKRLWRAFAHESDAPKATDKDKGWGDVITAAAAQGAVFGATGFARATGVWPGSTKDG